jgi:hypothetical protein
MLQCGHTLVADGYPQRLACPHCDAFRKVIAVECREWHIKCNACRYGRWFGQDIYAARFAASNHKHRGQMDILFQIKDSNRDRVRTYYGRSVRVHFGTKTRARIIPVPEIVPLFEPDDSEVPPF